MTFLGSVFTMHVQTFKILPTNISMVRLDDQGDIAFAVHKVAKNTNRRLKTKTISRFNLTPHQTLGQLEIQIHMNAVWETIEFGLTPARRPRPAIFHKSFRNIPT